MILTPPSWKFTSANSATIKLFGGKDEAAFTSKGPWDVAPKYQTDGKLSFVKAKQMIEKAMKEGTNFFEWDHMRLNGEVFPSTVLLSRIELDGKQQLQATVRDITERKNVESLLKESEEKYRLIAENTTDFIAVTAFNLKAEFLYVSPSYKTNLGYVPEELLGTSAMDFIHPDDKKKLLPLMKKYLVEKLKGLFVKRDTPITEIIEYRIKDKSGKWHILESTVNMLKDRLLFVSRDITKRKKAEKALQESYAELKRAQIQLIEAEKLEAIGRMASSVAHEVKNPLAIVLQGIDYFEGELVPTQKDEHEMLQIMKDSIKRADNIVRVLLDFSRSGDLKIEPEDIIPIVENSLILVQHESKLKSIDIIKELGKDMPKVYADRGKIEQVLINLLSNAIYFMPGGGKLFVRVYLSRIGKLSGRAGEAGLGSSKSDEEVVVLEIEDTGMGISKENTKQVFDPFFTTKGRTEGTGLGLAVVKKIIAMHNGLVFIESEQGKGTKVTMTLRPFGGV